MTGPKRSKKYILGILGILGGLLVLCIAVLAVSALINRGLPTQSETVDRLSELDKARLAELLHLKESLGEQVWPGLGQADIPIILYNEAYAFLIENPKQPPPGWTFVHSDQVHGGPWEPVPSDSFQGAVYYRSQLLAPNETPQAFTVQIGDRWAASMTTKNWTQIKLASMIRDELPPPLAAVFPYSLYTGVFNSDWHISAVLHEAFHAYIGTVDLERLKGSEAATAFEDDYPREDGGMQEDWQVELDLLAEALGATSDEQAANLAYEFLAQRENRRNRHQLDSSLVDYERQREWSEGLAKYIELEFWRQASENEAYEPLSSLAADPDFNSYTTFEKQWNQEVSQMKRMAGDDGDGRFYYSGMAQAVLLDRLMPGWKARAMQDGVFLEDLLSDTVGTK